MKWTGGFDGRKMSFHTASRRSQPPLALSVPLSRFTSRVGGGSAFFVRHRSPYEDIYMAFDSGVGSGVFYLLGDVWPDYEVTRRYRTRVAGFASHHGLFVPSESLDFV